MWSTGWDNTYSGPICAGLDQLTDHNRPLLALSLARCDLWTDWQTGSGQLFYDLSQEVSKNSEISQRPYLSVDELSSNRRQTTFNSFFTLPKYQIENSFFCEICPLRNWWRSARSRHPRYFGEQRGEDFSQTFYLPSLSQGLFNRKFASIRRVSFQSGPSFVL